MSMRWTLPCPRSIGARHPAFEMASITPPAPHVHDAESDQPSRDGLPLRTLDGERRPRGAEGYVSRRALGVAKWA